MKWAVFTAIIILAGASWGEEVFTTKNQALTLEIPDTWTKSESPDQSILFFGMQMPKQSTVMLMQGENPYLDTRGLKYFVYAMANQFDRFRFISAERDDFQNTKRLKLVFEAEMQGIEIRYIVSQFGQGWDYYQLIMSAPVRHFSSLLPEYEQILKSAKFKTSEEGAESLTSADMSVVNPLRKDPTLKSTKALFEALGNKKIATAQWEQHLAQGADLNWHNLQTTALQRAIQNNEIEKIGWLIENGAETKHTFHNASLILVTAKAPVREYWLQLNEKEGKRFPSKPITKRIVLKPPPESEFFQPIDKDPTEFLFDAIEHMRFEDATDAIQNGASLSAKHPEFKLTPLELTQKFINEMVTLGGDPEEWRKIERLLKQNQ